MPLYGANVSCYERYQPQEHDRTDNRCQQAPYGSHRNPTDQPDEPSAQDAAYKPNRQIDNETRSSPPDYLTCDPAGQQADD